MTAANETLRASGTGQMNLRLSDTAEARRLRAMLRAAERCDGSTIGMISVNVSPDDGLFAGSGAGGALVLSQAGQSSTGPKGETR